MKKNCRILFFLVLIFSACSKDNSESTSFNISNVSDKDIEFLFVSTIYNSSKSTVYRIDRQKEVTFGYDLDANGDGALKLTYKFVNSKDSITKDLGYYSNGYIAEKKWLLKIYADSIQIKKEYKDY